MCKAILRSAFVGGEITAGIAVLHTVDGIIPDDPSNICALFALERTQAAPQSECLNDIASLNILAILVTLDTCHFERSLLNDAAFQNMPNMSLTLDTSHFEISALNGTA